MAVRNVFVRMEVLKAVNAYRLNYMVSCNLPIHRSLKVLALIFVSS